MDEDIPHGYTMYGRGCRCDECKAGNAAKQRENRALRKSGPTPRHVHGTVNGFDNYGCKCKRCTAASRAAQRWRRARKRQLKERQAG